jgi:hypothetical protein
VFRFIGPLVEGDWTIVILICHSVLELLFVKEISTNNFLVSDPAIFTTLEFLSVKVIVKHRSNRSFLGHACGLCFVIHLLNSFIFYL